MAPEQKRTSNDEEVDKILAELGILSSGTGSSPQKASPASEKPAAPDYDFAPYAYGSERNYRE